MKASSLTEGIVFSIDMLMRNDDQPAAAHLVRAAGITLSDPVDRAVIHKMKAEGSITPETVSFIREHGPKPTPLRKPGKLTKAHYRVLHPIYKGGRQRHAGHTFHACTSGVHVQRWLTSGRIERIAESEVRA